MAEIPNEVENPDDPPTFFLSYARGGVQDGPIAQPIEAVGAFFRRLTEDVGQLLAPLPGQQLGFMDSSMEAGDVWSSELLWAAGRCGSFVALLSPAYLASEWCAMEWDLFASRQVVRRSGGRSPNSTAILPVLFTPLGDPIPRRVARIQIFRPDDGLGRTAALYLEHGVLGLYRMGLRDEFGTVAWTLARKIVNIVTAHEVRPKVPPNSSQLRRSFREGEQ